MANEKRNQDQPRKNQGGKGSDDRGNEGLTRGGPGRDQRNQGQTKGRQTDKKRGAQQTDRDR